MAELTVKIDPQDVVDRVLDEITYKGRTIREWADALTNPKTKGDELRAMSDEEFAEELEYIATMGFAYALHFISDEDMVHDWLDWLKSPVEVDADE